MGFLNRLFGSKESKDAQLDKLKEEGLRLTRAMGDRPTVSELEELKDVTQKAAKLGHWPSHASMVALSLKLIEASLDYEELDIRTLPLETKTKVYSYAILGQEHLAALLKKGGMEGFQAFGRERIEEWERTLNKIIADVQQKETAQSTAIPDSELALDAAMASSLISDASLGGTVVGLSSDGQRIVFATKQSLSPNEASGLQKAIEQGKVDLRLGLVLMPTYPVFALKPYILDDPNRPFWLETFPNIGGRDRAILQLMSKGGKYGTCFHFYSVANSLLFRAGYKGSFAPMTKIEQELAKAEDYIKSLSPSVRDYANAVQQFIQENP